MAAPGAMLSGALRTLTETRRRVLQTKTSATEKVKVQNKFEALQELTELHEDATADEQLEQMSILPRDPPGSKLRDDDCGEAKIPSKRKWKKVTEGLLCQLSEEDESWPRPTCSRSNLDCLGCVKSCSTPLRRAQQAKAGCGSCWAFQNPNQLRILIEKRSQSLMPLSGTNEREYLEFILDSGATATVIPPSVGKAYEIQPGDASRAGVTYEVANGEEIPNLGETLMPVVTAEGTWRGMRAQVADVTKALQSVRMLVKAGHMVVFGDGDDGDGNYIVNKITGEVTSVKDDCINYVLGLYIGPRSEAGFARPDH